MAVRPVFTAHPTEAARRTILATCARWPSSSTPNPVARTDRRLAEVVELLWLTDDLRVAEPDPLDEARNAIYYFDELDATVVGAVLDEWQATPWAASASTSARRPGAAHVRHLDRRRPGWQPQRHAGSHPRRDPVAARARHPPGSCVVVDGLRQDLAISSRHWPLFSDELAASLDSGPGRRSRSWRRGICGSTPRSRTG